MHNRIKFSENKVKQTKYNGFTNGNKHNYHASVRKKCNIEGI